MSVSRRLHEVAYGQRWSVSVRPRCHRDAVALFEAYSKSGEDSELKTWAGKTLPHLKEHLSMAEKLK
jgi:putative membrane protein